MMASEGQQNADGEGKAEHNYYRSLLRQLRAKTRKAAIMEAYYAVYLENESWYKYLIMRVSVSVYGA